MKKSKIVLLVLLVLAVFSLFMFSSWTNALVVSEGEIPAGLNVLSTISPLFIGIFIMAAIALLILISFD
ncbi:MAG: hypothetical protein ABIH92_05475 [Nanoarchaeota archaeon]